ncbi:MAG: hypothetical protein GX974_03085 [Clostridiales bacterium]|nr:hypothetical protein [Clostridiales bacterium]
MAYKKCPRCNLNYIKDTDVLCKICLGDVNKALRGNDSDEEEYDICPECGESIIKSGEEMCYRCRIENADNDIDGDEDDKDEDWDLYSSDDDIDTEDEDDELDDLGIIDEDFTDEYEED